MKLKISEIFYSLQGEGARAGMPNIFIRVSGCKAKHACFSMGIKCDTEFESGKEYTLEELLAAIEEFPSDQIIWTGGEPADRITDAVVEFFHEHGYCQCIETSGLFPVSELLDYVVVSPKVAEHVVAKHFTHVDELRYVRHSGQDIPQPSITADKYYISPHSDGMEINLENVRHCVELCKRNPEWSMSVQMHKVWNVL